MGLFREYNNTSNCERNRVKKYNSISLEDVISDLQNGESIFQYIAQGNFKVVKSWLYGLDRSITMALKDKAGWSILHVAVILNNQEISSYLINNPMVDVNIPCNSQSVGLLNWRPIHVACEFGNSDILKILIKANCNAELITEAVKSDLIEPISVGNIPERNMSYNILDTFVILEGWTPLHIAVIHEQYECLDILLKEAIVYIDARSIVKRKTALILACQLSQLKIVNRLLMANANPNCEDTSGKTALYYAAKRGNASIVELLLKFGSNPRILTKKYNMSALHIACISRNPESLTAMFLLINAAPDVLEWECEYIIKITNNILHCSTINCFMLCVLTSCLSANDLELKLYLEKINRLLGDCHVDINSMATINKISQMNALHTIIFIFKKCHFTFKSDLANLILTYSININHTNSNNESVLFNSVKLNLIGFISNLLQRNCDANISDRNGMTPLMLAVNNRYTDIIMELLKYKTEINHIPCTQIFTLDNIQFTNCTALHLALINGDIKTMEILIKHGANYYSTINILESQGIQTEISLLHLAALSNYKSIDAVYSFLLDLDLDMESVTSNNETPLLFTAKYGNLEACKILLSKGVNKNAVNNMDQTSLIIAAINKNVELMELLLHHKVDINKQDSAGYTAFHHCFLKKNRFAIDLFLHGFPCQCQIPEENIDMDSCCLCFTSIMATLQVNICSFENKSTFLSLALVHGTEIDVKALIDLNADLNCVFIHNEITMTPIFLAVEMDSYISIKNLIEHGCDLTYVSSPNQETILHAALRNRNCNISKDLIYAGINLEARSIMGQGQEVLPMHVAVQNGLDDMIMLLIKFGCSANSTMTLKTVERVSPLHLAALNDLTPTVKLLALQNLVSVHINSTRSDSFNALLTLVSKKNEKGVQAILEAGADVSSRCVVSRSRNATCLHIAAQVGNVEIVRLLLEYGADPFARMMTGDRDGILPIHLATESGHLDIVQLFFEWGVSVSAAEDCGLTCLHYAANSGRHDIMNLLLAAGADVTIEATDGNRSMMLPIHMASEKGHLDAVKLLLKYGSPINAVFSRVNRDNISSLYIATSENRDDVLNYLIKCGADPNIQESNLGAAPMHIACQRGHMKPLEYLIGIAHSDLNVTLHTGISSLHLTAEKGHDELSFWLLRFKCDPNLKGQITDSYSKKTSYMISPLNQACGFGHLAIVKMLLKSGADKDWAEIFEGHEGIRPIHCAAIRGRYHIISTLIETGVNINQLDSKGRTALHWAVIEGFYDCVKVLLELEADINTVDKDGNKPIDYAETANIKSLLIF